MFLLYVNSAQKPCGNSRKKKKQIGFSARYNITTSDGIASGPRHISPSLRAQAVGTMLPYRTHTNTGCVGPQFSLHHNGWYYCAVLFFKEEKETKLNPWEFIVQLGITVNLLTCYFFKTIGRCFFCWLPLFFKKVKSDFL